MDLTEDMKRVIAEQRLCYAATVCEDGSPNLSPKGTIGVFDAGTIMFGDIRSPRTIENLERDPRIEVNVIDPVRRRRYRFKGRARVIASAEDSRTYRALGQGRSSGGGWMTDSAFAMQPSHVASR